MRGGSPGLAKASALALPPASPDRILASSHGGTPFCRLRDHEAILPILRLRLGDCFRLDRLYGMRMHKGQTMGSMHADYGASALNSFTRPGERFHFDTNRIY